MTLIEIPKALEKIYMYIKEKQFSYIWFHSRTYKNLNFLVPFAFQTELVYWYACMRYCDLILNILFVGFFCSETILITGNKSNIILEGGGRDNTILSWKTSGLRLREATLMLKRAYNFIAKGITFKVINFF